jgi:hypothetical protein
MVHLLMQRDRVALTALTFEHVLRSALFFLKRQAIFDPTAEPRANALKAMAEQLLARARAVAAGDTRFAAACGRVAANRSGSRRAGEDRARPCVRGTGTKR